MFERFTERARQVVVLAQEEARSDVLKHDYIGTEHMLLGLLREGEGIAARVLGSCDMTAERARAQVVRIVGTGEAVPSGQIPFTPRAKAVLETAIIEAGELGHNYVGTEHILLALAREPEGVATRILLDFNATGEEIRDRVMQMLAGPTSPRHGSGPGSQQPSRRRVRSVPEGSSAAMGSAIDPGWLGGLPRLLAPLGVEIRAELGRAPDVGDLLLACACVPRTPAAEALSELGIDLDRLWALVERARAQNQAAVGALAERMRGAAQAKEKAIEDGQLEEAARLRDQERELREQAQAHVGEQLAALDDLRRRLGLPRPPAR